MADSILRLRVQSEEYDQKIKRAAEGIQKYASECRKVGDTLEVVERDTLDFVKSLGRMETVSKTAKGGLSEMTKAFTDLKMQYKQLTDAEKQSPFGQELNNSLNQLKSRIIETKNDLKGIEGELSGSKFGKFGNIIDSFGQKFGVAGNLTEMLTSKTALLTGAIGAGTTAVVAATKAWADYNSEIAKQQQITTVTTGLNGDDADKMTSAARALSKTYNTDFRDAINAANTLMSQFGATGDEAIKLLQDGMRGMIRGDGPKLLSMIQQYAPAFRDAGVSASQLVAVIQNSEGGIFTDQNMNAIVMGIKNIRLMTKQTSEALAQLGIDGEEMTRKLNDGSMTIFDALKQVAGQLKNVDSNSQAAGQVMQAVFGRHGAMAGTNLAKAIEGLNTNLEETKRQTGEVGKAYDELYEANVRLEQALQKTFGYKGWEEMATGIKTKVVGAMADVLECIDKINTALDTNVVADYFNGMFDMATKAMGPLGNVLRMLKNINKEQEGGDVGEGAKTGGLGGIVPQNIIPEVVIYGNNRKNTKTTKPTGGNKTPKTDEQLNNEEIQKLTQEYIHASEQRQAAIREEIKVLQERNELIQALKNQAQGKGFDPTKLKELTGGAPAIEFSADMKRGKNGKWYDATGLTLPVMLDIQSPEEKLREEVARLQELLTNAFTDAEREALSKALKDKKGQLDNLTGGKDNSKPKEVNFTQEFSKMAGGIQSIVGGIESLGVELPQGLKDVLGGIQGVISILTGISTIITAIEALSAADTIIPFAHGGIVHAANGYVSGNNYSGDMVPALLNSGELILNRAQQGVIAGELEGGAGRSVHVTGMLRGEDIVLVADRWGRRTGKGELAFWK